MQGGEAMEIGLEGHKMGRFASDLLDLLFAIELSEEETE
jgi:hypothetical protein